MRSLVHILKARDEDQDTYEKVKIAVLDTGVHPNHVEADYIKGYKDFVSREDNVKCDNSGHGTTLIRLILDMCESADVYALRIFERDTAAKETQHLAAEVSFDSFLVLEIAIDHESLWRRLSTGA